MMATIYDGPHANEKIDVNETTWQYGILFVPERIKPTLPSDAFVEPRIARYIKRRRHRAGVTFWVWKWDGWRA